MDFSPSRPRIQNFIVENTPGGSLGVTDKSLTVQRIPGGNHRAVADEVPLCSNTLKRVEAIDVSDEEVAELLQEAPWHVLWWVKGKQI